MEKFGWNRLIETVYFYGFITKEQKEVNEIVIENLDFLKKAWDEYFEE
ncbi:hypothetical protein SAMN05444280_10870 [Tangfeifania diversioriginum]|uniref:Uncharacterized protein n=1 Tax=Tangfeifania diversioriginum TaxID=1168035 RepID=A0A1M6F8P1_9BACT|nr:hypothetical protein [Tangfeifania diversioriginum]SHI93969.1 hypothetical protein SAMN05444280_10870 [Tangfeifania diversioriginum]